MRRCNYHRLMASFTTGAYVADAEQCPNAATRYTRVDQYAVGDRHGVTHYVNLCDEHDRLASGMEGWVSSEPKKVFA